MERLAQEREQRQVKHANAFRDEYRRVHSFGPA
jgi:hypothetical protein